MYLFWTPGYEPPVLVRHPATFTIGANQRARQHLPVQRLGALPGRRRPSRRQPTDHHDHRTG
ncbi:MAG: hypothetical protein V9G12_26170, partial [Microthrixaceae bacterium]